jgi:ABC-type nitrate/sulfonate/bicarbonate transport system substrate-binding protein
MSKAKLYSPDRLVLLSTASDYLRANPGTTSKQLMQLFALNQNESLGVVHGVRNMNAVKADVMKKAVEWAIANNAGFMRIQERYGMSENNARRVALAAKAANAANAANIADAKAKLDKATEYAIAHPHEATPVIAAKFGVSSNSIERIRRQWRQRQAVPAEPARWRERVRFRQITDADLDWDGSRILDDVVRFPSRLGFAVFREVR